MCAALEEDNSHRIALRTILENILPFLAGLGLCPMPLPDDERGPHHEIRLES